MHTSTLVGNIHIDALGPLRSLSHSVSLRVSLSPPQSLSLSLSLFVFHLGHLFINYCSVPL